LEEKFWNAPCRYIVPWNLVKPGRNVIAIRACSFIKYGGLIGPVKLMRTSLKAFESIMKNASINNGLNKLEIGSDSLDCIGMGKASMPFQVSLRQNGNKNNTTIEGFAK